MMYGGLVIADKQGCVGDRPLERLVQVGRLVGGNVDGLVQVPVGGGLGRRPPRIPPPRRR